MSTYIKTRKYKHWAAGQRNGCFRVKKVEKVATVATVKKVEEEMTPVAPQTVSPPRPALPGEVSETEHTGTVLTFDCRNNEPPTNDDLNGGLSSVIS